MVVCGMRDNRPSAATRLHQITARLAIRERLGLIAAIEGDLTVAGRLLGYSQRCH